MDNVNAKYDFPVTLQPIFLSNGKPIEKRQAVVRTDTMDTLGIVSDDYGLVKHSSVIDSFREAGRKFKVEEKISLAKNGAYLFYQMQFPKVEAEVRKGDFIRMMMIAKNSYNGTNALQVIFGAFRLVCLNGMIIGTHFMQFSFRHVGSLGNIDNKFIMDQYKDTYSNYIKLFGEKTPQISAMARKPLHRVSHLYKPEVVKLPEYLLNEARFKYDHEKDKTVWGYYNSLTYAVTHKMRKENADRSIKYGVEAWKAAERVMN